MTSSRKRLLDDILQLYGSRATDVVTSVLNNEHVIIGVQRILVASLEFRDFMQKAVTAALEQINVPSKDDTDRLAELLMRLDERLDDIEQRLTQIENAQTRPKPRSRKKGAPGAEDKGSPT